MALAGSSRARRFRHEARGIGGGGHVLEPCAPSNCHSALAFLHFGLDSPGYPADTGYVRTCVIFNPTAKGDKARRFRSHLDEFGAQCTLKLTAAAGDARRLAAEAVVEGFEIVIAAGGDGTVNEALNGLGDVPNGFERTSLGVLPLGTVNVFAQELAMPTRLKLAWEILMRGRQTAIDLPKARFHLDGKTQNRYFAQLAGAGLDARAVELVHWPLKKKIGRWAYVVAGLNALRGAPAKITVSGEGFSSHGGLALIGNGRFYGGPFRIFPEADLRDGLLEVCVFPRVNWFTLARCAPPLLLRGRLPASSVRLFKSACVRLEGAALTPLELDGELAGHLPAVFSIEQGRLRVIVP